MSDFIGEFWFFYGSVMVQTPFFPLRVGHKGFIFFVSRPSRQRYDSFSPAALNLKPLWPLQR